MPRKKANPAAATAGVRQGVFGKERQAFSEIATSTQAGLEPRPATRPIADIIIGERHRKDLGDIDGLARSIAELGGLLQPIVVHPDGRLIAGERRVRAAKLLGWTDIPVNVVDLDDIVRGEHAENAIRKDFTLSEAVAIKRALEPLEKAAAKERQQAAGEQGKKGGRGKRKPSGQVAPRVSRASDKAAKATGVARRTLEKAEAIVDAAEAEPEKFGKLLADMDRTGRANGVFKRLKVIKQAALIRAEPPPLPGRGPYRVVVADPPWPYEICDDDPSHRAVLPYTTMSIAQICALPVASIMHEDSIVWLWTTNHHMREAFNVLEAWGFACMTILTWAKDRFGYGDLLRNQTEHCLMGVRGKPIVTLTNQTTLLQAPVRGHSVKPLEFYDLVESLCPAPRYADLFSRYRHNERWDCHGDQAPAGPYDGLDDFAKSLDEGYRVIRERVAAGGPGWTPHEASASEPQTQPPAAAEPTPREAAPASSEPDELGIPDFLRRPRNASAAP